MKDERGIEIRPWWQRIFTGHFKYFWKCPVSWCFFQFSVTDPEAAVKLVQVHEDWHDELHAKGRP